MNANNVCAVILTGGRSRRMGGTNKTFKKFNNQIIFDRIFNRIQNQVSETIINSNDDKNLFVKYNVNVTPDILEGFLGPLAGIHSSFRWYIENKKKYDWLVSVPGDTPFIPNDLVNKFIKKTKDMDNKIVIAKSFGKIHPTVGLWHTSLYENLEESLKRGHRKILDWANNHSVGYVDFDESKYDPFFNINYIEDIKKAEAIENNFFK